MKKISIIIPCYNVEKWVDRCVHSLVKQTIGIEHLELIFVDDASTDSTLAHLKKWEKRFPESVVIVTCEENGKQGTAKNIGLTYATAPYVGYVDADDWVERDMYEILYDCAVRYDTEITTGMMGRDEGDGIFREVKPYDGPTDEKIVIRTKEDRHELFKNGLPGCNCTRLFQKSFLQDHHLFFPEHMAYEDNYFGMMMIFEVSSIYVVNKLMYHYFVNPWSTVTKRNSPHQLDRLKIEQMILSYIDKKGYLEEFREELMPRFLKMYYLNTLHLIFTRFDTLPLEVLEEMKTTVLEKYPDWKQTKQYEELSEIEKGFLQTLEVEMTEEMWQNLKDNYLMLVRKK